MRHLFFRRFLCATLLLLLSVPVVVRTAFDLMKGGTAWRQGDWLINFESGLVRRGLFGEFFMTASDALGIHIIFLLTATQISLFFIAVVLVWIIASASRFLDATLLITSSSLFFPIFWAADSQGIMRKEIFGYIAILLIATIPFVRSSSNRSFLLYIASMTLILGCLGNALNILLCPALIFGLYLLRDGRYISNSSFFNNILLSVFGSVSSLAFAFAYTEASSLSLMCSPLLERDVNPLVCEGAMKWISAGSIDHTKELHLKLTIANLTAYFTTVAIGVIPLVYFFFLVSEKKTSIAIFAATFLPLFPLYAIATDWGRWASISFTTFAILTYLALHVGRLSISVNKIPRSNIASLAIIAAFISPEHGIGWKLGGSLANIIQSFRDVF